VETGPLDGGYNCQCQFLQTKWALFAASVPFKLSAGERATRDRGPRHVEGWSLLEEVLANPVENSEPMD